MKKKTIVFGSLMAVFLMLMIPNIGAVEYNSVKDTVESKMNTIQGKCTTKFSALQSLIRTVSKKEINLDLIGLILSLVLISFMPLLSVYQVFETIKEGNILTSLIWVLNFFIGLKNLKMVLNTILDNSEPTENLNLA